MRSYSINKRDMADDGYTINGDLAFLACFTVIVVGLLAIIGWIAA